MKITFGKYKGKGIKEIPSDYLKYLLDNAKNLEPKFVKSFNLTLKARDKKGTHFYQRQGKVRLSNHIKKMLPEGQEYDIGNKTYWEDPLNGMCSVTNWEDVEQDELF